MSIRIDYQKVTPAGVKALGGVYSYIVQSGLDAVLVELVYLRVSQINGCAYCLDLHTRDLTQNGVKVEKLALVQAWQEAGWTCPVLFPPLYLVSAVICSN